MHSRSEVEIARVAAEVFVSLCEAAQLQLWLSELHDAERSLDAPVGTQLRMRFRQMGGGLRDVVAEIVQNERNQTLAYRMVDRSFEIVIRLVLTPTADGTRVTQDLEATARAPEMAAMASHFWPQAQQQHQRDLEKLKQLVEQAAHT